MTLLEVLLIVILSGSPIHRSGISFDCDTPLQCFKLWHPIEIHLHVALSSGQTLVVLLLVALTG